MSRRSSSCRWGTSAREGDDLAARTSRETASRRCAGRSVFERRSTAMAASVHSRSAHSADPGVVALELGIVIGPPICRDGSPRHDRRTRWRAGDDPVGTLERSSGRRRSARSPRTPHELGAPARSDIGQHADDREAFRCMLVQLLEKPRELLAARMHEGPQKFTMTGDRAARQSNGVPSSVAR